MGVWNIGLFLIGLNMYLSVDNVVVESLLCFMLLMMILFVNFEMNLCWLCDGVVDDLGLFFVGLFVLLFLDVDCCWVRLVRFGIRRYMVMGMSNRCFSDWFFVDFVIREFWVFW